MLKERYIKEIKNNNRLQLLIAEVTNRKTSTIDTWMRNEDKWVNFLDYRILYLLSVFYNVEIVEIIDSRIFESINKSKSMLNVL